MTVLEQPAEININYYLVALSGEKDQGLSNIYVRLPIDSAPDFE